MKRMAVLVVALLALVAGVARADTWYSTYLVNQTGGVADSMAAAADTCTFVTAPLDISNLFITSIADSNSLRYIQVATSTSTAGVPNRWATVVFDSLNVVSGNFAKGRVSGDLAPYLRGKRFRVIIDRAKSAAGWGQSWVQWYK